MSMNTSTQSSPGRGGKVISNENRNRKASNGGVAATVDSMSPGAIDETRFVSWATIETER